jgi:hypothetical protein
MAKTRKMKTGKGKVLHVRSPNELMKFDNLIMNGPLTMIFVKKETCGPCQRFQEQVWSPLTQLQNKNMNLATVDSEVYNQTGLPPVSQYPTLMLVGKDKEPAMFNDQDTGEPTNSLPRKNTLEEDLKTLKALIQQPKKNVPNLKLSGSKSNVNSMPRETSPYKEDTVIPSEMLEVSKMPTVMSSQTADAAALQGTFPSGIAKTISLQRGGLLQKIRKETAALKAILKMRRAKSYHKKSSRRNTRQK